MGIYSTVESGTTAYKSRFHKSISYSKNYDCQFGQCVPVLEQFVLPGDIWRIGGNALIRFLPMVSPSMTSNKFKVRYFFVPLRLLDENAEFIITGSQDGHFDKTKTVPTFKNFVDDADKTVNANAFKLTKHKFYDYLGVPLGDYESIKTDECLPAQYWHKAFCRIRWDYYQDENFGPHTTYTDFESWYEDEAKNGLDRDCFYSMLPKDYFTSALPWQLKGNTPMINISGTANITPNFGQAVSEQGYIYDNLQQVVSGTIGSDVAQEFGYFGGVHSPQFLRTDLNDSSATEETKLAALDNVKKGVTNFF